jgi:branched-chain amino acid transport system permease protein
MPFLLALIIDGALAGAIYALIALAFVLVYKATRMINFALGEWMMFGVLLAACGWHVLALGPVGALLFAAAAMVALGAGFSRLVLRRLVARPAIAAIMVTLGLAMMMRGGGSLLFADMPRSLPLPVPAEPIRLAGLPLATDKVAAAAVAAVCVAAIGAFYRYSRTGIALRALADDAQAAMSTGIDAERHLLLVWGLAGAIAVVAGVLWTMVTGGGFGVALLGLKVFPIVIVGGLDSIAGTIVGAILIGVMESVGTGYLDPYLGGGFGNIVSYGVLFAMLTAQPHGLFGQARVERV